MLDIQSILTFMMNGIAQQDPRFVVEDDEHIIDTKTGINLHVYDNWFKVTHEDSNVVTKEDFTSDEQMTVWSIKKLITAPEVLKQREVDYKPLQIARRKYLSDLFENPIPLDDNKPKAEPGAATYIG